MFSISREASPPTVAGIDGPNHLFAPSLLAVEEANLITKIGQVLDPCLGQPLQYNGSVKSVNLSQSSDVLIPPDSFSGAMYKVIIALDLFVPGHPGTCKVGIRCV